MPTRFAVSAATIICCVASNLTMGEDQTQSPPVAKSAASQLRALVDKYPALPQAVTSFGAAIAGDALYVYGGHTGRAHAYYKEAQENTLWRLDLNDPQKWQAVAKGPRLQGLALVAVGEKLYRIGGFTAKNKEDQEQDLWSQASVACFDSKHGRWEEISSLPQPRSSFDAAVLDGKIYVIGGWQLRGGKESTWHQSAYVFDTSADSAKWESLPKPPFARRALSVAAHDGKLFAIGGMQKEGGPTTRVDVFDPAQGKWATGPSLHGEGLAGFGSSAFAVGDRLYVSTLKGNLQRLSADGQSWEIVGTLERARFFHRMLPRGDHHLISVGGADMSIGKFDSIDEIEVP